jgi:hypothetical protein
LYPVGRTLDGNEPVKMNVSGFEDHAAGPSPKGFEHLVVTCHTFLEPLSEGLVPTRVDGTPKTMG